MIWLLSVAVGPVGRFISAGRRSRDLWWGSTWLSECALAAAEALVAGSATPLVPSPARLIRMRRDPLHAAQYGLRVSNHLLLRVEASDAGAVRALAQRAEQAARAHLLSRLEEGWRAARARLGISEDIPNRGHLAGVLDADAWERQRVAIEGRADFLEFYATWTPDGEDRRAALERLGALMDARKGARTFLAPEWKDGGLRKSDLDPGRPSVLVESRIADARDADRRARARRAALRRAWLGVGTGEDLDAIGLTRRMGRFGSGSAGHDAPTLDVLPFPPLSRVALDPWLVRAQREAPRELASLRDLLRRHQGEPAFSLWCSSARDPDRDAHDPGQIFPFDASLLLEDGISALEAELGAALEGVTDELAAPLERARRTLSGEVASAVRDLHAHPALGLPPSYVALLAMDGDGVGNAIHEAIARGDHENLVKMLDEFALQAPQIVREEGGCAFYAAGDELMAFLPVDRALQATERLAEAFGPVRAAAPGVSLSGGLVIVHLKHDLRDLREEAEDALRSAKKARHLAGDDQSWLEVRELPRSGVKRVAEGRLAELCESLRTWAQGILSEQISLRSAEKILTQRERFEEAGNVQVNGREEALGVELLRAELVSQERRSGRASGERFRAKVTSLTTWTEAGSLAHELMIARRVGRIVALRDQPRGGGES